MTTPIAASPSSRAAQLAGGSALPASLTLAQTIAVFAMRDQGLTGSEIGRRLGMTRSAATAATAAPQSLSERVAALLGRLKG